MRLVFVVILALLFFVTVVTAEIAPQNAKRAERLAPLIEWVKKEGHDVTFEARAAEMLGLGHGALRVKRMAYQDDETKIIYALHVSPIGADLVYILMRLTSADSNAWLIQRSGAVEKLLYVQPHSDGLSKDPHLVQLEETLAYLENEMHNAQH